MLKLYGGARSRASIVRWFLEEISVPYEFVMLDMQSGAHLQPDYLAIAPMGKVPAIVEDSFQLWESGAILLYLAEKHGQLSTLEERAIAAQWVFFANSTLSSGLFSENIREQETPRLLQPLNEILGRQSFLQGDRFGIADVSVGAVLAYVRLMLNLSYADYPAIEDYLQRLSERPAFQKNILNRS